MAASLAALVDLAADWAMVTRTGRGVPTIDMRVDYHAAAMPGDLTVKGRVVKARRAVLDRRGACLRRCRQAARERPRHLFHRAAAAGNSVTRPDAHVDQSRRSDPARARISTRLRSSISAARRAARIHFRALDDAPAAWRGRLTARGLSRGERVAILSANRAEYLAAYYGIMRAGLVAVPVNFKFPRETIDFILARFRREAGVLRSRRGAPIAPADIPQSCGQLSAYEAFERFLDPGPFAGDSAAATSPRCSSTPRARPAAQRRRAVASEPYLGGARRGSAAGSLAPPLSHRGAALSHECAGACRKLACAAHATHRAAAAIHGARTISRRSSAIAAPG